MSTMRLAATLEYITRQVGDTSDASRQYSPRHGDHSVTPEGTMLNTIIQTLAFSLMSLTVLATTAVVVWNGLAI